VPVDTNDKSYLKKSKSLVDSGPPNKVLKRVDIPQMENVFNELDFIDKQIQSVSGATAIETGGTYPNDDGAEQAAQEIQILAANRHASCRGLKMIRTSSVVPCSPLVPCTSSLNNF
jgi:hypothetical protein